MKIVIIYYSMSGNTKFAAEKIAQKLGADIIRIEQVKAYPNRGAKKEEFCSVLEHIQK